MFIFTVINVNLKGIEVGLVKSKILCIAIAIGDRPLRHSRLILGISSGEKVSETNLFETRICNRLNGHRRLKLCRLNPRIRFNDFPHKEEFTYSFSKLIDYKSNIRQSIIKIRGIRYSMRDKFYRHLGQTKLFPFAIFNNCDILK